MSGWTDERLERELRELLRGRDAGAAPLGLQARIDGIPDMGAPSRREQVARSFAPLLAVAAVLLIAVLAGQALRLSVPAVGPGASPAPSPASTFDPTLEGPGIGSTVDAGPLWALVLVVDGVLVLLAITIRGRRRLVPAIVAAILFGWALFGSYYPVSVSAFSWGPRLGVVEASMPAGTDLSQFYVVAPPRQPFAFLLGVTAEGTVPVRLEGLTAMPGDVATNASLRWTAVWLDADANGGSSGPFTPFAPFDLNGRPRSLWVVGRAGACAVGPSFDQKAPNAGGFTVPSIQLRFSVLGWPHVVDLRQPAIVEPDTGRCLGPTASPSPSTAP